MSWSKTPISSRSLCTLLVFILSCAPTYSWSQDSQEPDTDSKTTDAQDQGADADTPEPQAINENSPSDYQASEEISQDLSVSFPADI
jgi:hypothetical protein